jgi:hypothetical protein
LLVAACGLDLVGTTTTDGPIGSSSSGGVGSTTPDGARANAEGGAPSTDEGGTPIDDAGNDAGPVKPSLSIARQSVPTTLDLDTEGALGWIHWGITDQNSIDEKANAKGVIPTFQITGSTELRNYGDNRTSFQWSNGTPTAATTGTPTGVYSRNRGGNPIFTISRKAGVTTALRLVIYAGVSHAKGTMTAKLGDGTAVGSVSADLDNASDNDYGRWVIDFRATDPETMLVVTYVLTGDYDPNNSNITLAAATLAPN